MGCRHDRQPGEAREGLYPVGPSHGANLSCCMEQAVADLIDPDLRVPLHQVGAHVGSVLKVTMQLPTGGSRSVPFRVVGTASFPSDAGGGLGTGSAFTMAGYLNAVCPLDVESMGAERRSRPTKTLSSWRGRLPVRRAKPTSLAMSLRAVRAGRPSQPRWSTSGRR